MLLILILSLFGFSFSSLLLLIKWKRLVEFIFINLSIVFIYTFLAYKFDNNKVIPGFYFKTLVFLTLHSFLIFIFSIYIFATTKKKNEKTT
ncbi:hypothetical protein LPB136_07985 [Tenacibaculum todarodis]|uniref:Uncharacterized protein n=1 Tax=Tenacibaculum todarodis TaxID=1850252 RepID=A0A1L3JJM3_9FLAO|nr:hypothetical protein LPB136_07985 [Tenacibaculum todarodis]